MGPNTIVGLAPGSGPLGRVADKTCDDLRGLTLRSYSRNVIGSTTGVSGVSSLTN